MADYQVRSFVFLHNTSDKKPMKSTPVYLLTTTLILFNLLISKQVTAQEFVDWSIFADVRFEETYDDATGLSLLNATFGEYLQDLDGKTVSVRGFMIPLDPFGTSYVLSQNPNSSCFFCGGAGPETIVGLLLKPQAVRRYETDEYRTFKGTLQLNKLNDKHFTYMLIDAEPF